MTTRKTTTHSKRPVRRTKTTAAPKPVVVPDYISLENSDPLTMAKTEAYYDNERARLGAYITAYTKSTPTPAISDEVVDISHYLTKAPHCFTRSNRIGDSTVRLTGRVREGIPQELNLLGGSLRFVPEQPITELERVLAFLLFEQANTLSGNLSRLVFSDWLKLFLRIAPPISTASLSWTLNVELWSYLVTTIKNSGRYHRVSTDRGSDLQQWIEADRILMNVKSTIIAMVDTLREPADNLHIQTEYMLFRMALYVMDAYRIARTHQNSLAYYRGESGPLLTAMYESAFKAGVLIDAFSEVWNEVRINSDDTARLALLLTAFSGLVKTVGEDYANSPNQKSTYHTMIDDDATYLCTFAENVVASWDLQIIGQL